MKDCYNTPVNETAADPPDHEVTFEYQRQRRPRQETLGITVETLY